MPYIDKIVDYINATLKAGTLNRKDFQKGVFYGLAKQITIKNEQQSSDGQISLRPFIYSLNGKKEIDPFINDVFPFQIYHRVPSISYKIDNASSFGDDINVTETANMIAVIYGDPERLSITQEDLSFLILTGLPMNIENSNLGNTKLNSIKITPTSVNNNSLQVFTSEYQSGDYALKPQSIYFAVNYQIETKSDKLCLTCPDC